MLYQIVQVLVQLNFENFQRRRFCNSTWQSAPFPVLTISFLQNRFSSISSVDSCPFTLYTLEVKSHFNFCWDQPFIHPEEFQFSHLLLSTMWSILVAFHEATECFGIFCALRTPKLVITFHIWFHKWQIEEEIYFPQPTGCAFTNTYLHSQCEGWLLVPLCLACYPPGLSGPLCHGAF